MATTRFDHLTRSLTTVGARRGLLTRLAVVPLGAGLLAIPGAPAVARKGKKKVTICQGGQTIQVKKRLRQGATKGACSPTPPPPTPPECAADRPCAAGKLCVEAPARCAMSARVAGATTGCNLPSMG